MISVTSYNKEIEADANRQFEIWNRYQDKTPNHLVVNINQKTTDTVSAQEKIEVLSKPNLNEWPKNNRGKTINDYFTKFGR